MTSPDTLLQHATWLRRLAAGLVGDRALADDLVQDTWVAALRRPPDLHRPLRPWLARVVRNAARFRWRGEAHRSAREAAVAAHADTTTPTSEELLARHQLERQLAALVAELDEPFRATILLRYAEGLEPGQIARRLGIPGGTVRWRIREALERLRRGLDDAHAGDRKAWLLALAPIALWSRGARGAPIAPALAIGLAGAAALAVALATTTHPTAGTHPAAAVAQPPTLPAAPADTHPEIGDSQSWFVQDGARSRQLTGRVVDHAHGNAAVAGAVVRLVADGADPIELRTGADGRFDFGDQPARELSLGADPPAGSPALAAIVHLDLRDPTAPSDVELALIACSARITGRVTDASGTPIAHARVLREDVVGTETDAAGAYELCARPTAALVSQLDIVVRADGYGAIAAGVAPAGRVRRDFVLAPEATISGTAAPRAAIWIEPELDDSSRTAERPARHVAIADADGRFHVAGASGGQYRVGGAARGQLAVASLVTVAAGGAAEVTVRMVPAATVRGRVVMHGAPVAGAHVQLRGGTVVMRHDDPARDAIAPGDAVTQADGRFELDPVPVGPAHFTALPVRVADAPIELVAGDNTITLDGEPLGRIRGVVRRHGEPVPFARVDMNGVSPRGVTTGADGRFDLDGLEPGRYGFYADDGRRGAYVTMSNIALGDGEIRDLDLELAWGAEVRGEVVDASGAPVAGVNVRMTSPDGEQARCTTDATGAFACGSLHGGASFAATVTAGDDATRPFPFVGSPPPAIAVGDDASVTGVHLAIDPRTVSLSGTVVDERDAPAVEVRVRASGDGVLSYAWSPALAAITDASGRFHIDHLAPGAYALDAATLDGARTAHRTTSTETAETTLTLAPARDACAPDPRGAPRQLHAPDAPMIWDDRIELVGWDVPATARAGEAVEVALVFRVRAPLAHAWRVFAHLDGARRVTADHAPLGDTCSTTAWKAGDAVVDRFPVTLPVAGAFALHVGFFRRPGGDRPSQDLAGPGDLTGADLGTITAD